MGIVKSGNDRCYCRFHATYFDVSAWKINPPLRLFVGPYCGIHKRGTKKEVKPNEKESTPCLFV